MNISAHTNARCLAAMPPATAWKCFIAPEVLPFITTPIFVSNSLSDQWQSSNIMGLGCTPSNAKTTCTPAQLAYLAKFRTDMLTALQPVTSKDSPHGGFLQGCYVHVVEDTSSWTKVVIGNQTQSSTFWSWFTGGDEAATPYVQVGSFPPWSNPTC